MDLFGMYGARADDEQPRPAEASAIAERVEATEDAVAEEPLADPAVKNTAGAPEPDQDEFDHRPAPPSVQAMDASDDQTEEFDWPKTDDDLPGDSLEVEADPLPVEFNPAVDGSALVRPYIRTGGRTEADLALALEALIVAIACGTTVREHERPEYGFICALCAVPHSVAEISAHTKLPINTARIIVADMIGIGLLQTCSNEPESGSPSRELMERVLRGLHRL